MKTELTVTCNNFTEQDMQNFLFEARDKIGIKGGQQIPSQIYDFQVALITIMFEYPKECTVSKG